jgi:hypothetical protein
VAGISVVVQGTNATSSTVQIQVIPLRIDINPGNPIAQVGDSVQFSATAVDVNEGPIPGLTYRWQVTGENGGNSRAASITNDGVLRTNGVGIMTIHAQFVYSGQSGAEIGMFEGLTRVEIRLRKEFKLTRLLANIPMERQFTMRPASNGEPAINDSGQIAFTANLEGLDSALMFYDGTSLQLVNTTGIPGPIGGYVWNFEGPPAINNRGEILVRVGTSNGSGLMRVSPFTGFTYFMENGTAEGFARTNTFRVGRYSFNDQGDMAFLANYVLVGETVQHTGLFVLNDQSFRWVITDTDPLPPFSASFSFDTSFFGIDQNGIVYFRATSGRSSAIFRVEPYSNPVKVLATNDTLSGVQVQDVVNLAMSQNGSLAFSINGNNGQTGIVRLRAGEKNLEYLSQRSVGPVLSINDSGDTLYVGDPGKDPGRGIYVWQSDASQVLRFGSAPLEGGEKPNSVRIGKITASRQIYASLDSPQNHLLVARLDGRFQTLWKGGTVLRLPGQLNFQGLVPGAQVGGAHTFGGGQNASILEVTSSGVRPVWVPGDQPVSTISGTSITHASKGPSGDMYLTLGDGILHIGSTAEAIFRFPIDDAPANSADKTTVRGPTGFYDGNNSFSANSIGTFVFNARTDRENRLELYDRGRLTPIMIQGGTSQTSSPGGGKFSGIAGAPMRQNAVAIDERGRVLVTAQVTGGSAGIFLYDGGQWTSAALLNQTGLSGSIIRACRSIRVAGEMFYAMLDLTNGDVMIAQFDGRNWTPLVRRFDVMPDGAQLNNFFGGFAVNRKGELLWAANANGEKIVFRTADGVNHLVYSEMTRTEDGDFFPSQNIEFDLRDDGTVYFSAADSTDRSTIYRADRLR